MKAWFRFALWFLLALPLAVLTWDYGFGETYYGGYVHLTGRIAAWLLLLALAPLRLSFPGAAWPRLLLAHRRAIGVAVFAYAAAHLIAYLARQDWARIAGDLGSLDMVSGWIAFFVFAALAATSNDAAVRRLRHYWKSLHRLVHPAALLVFLHWAWTAFDPFLAWCHIGALMLLEAWRLALRHRISQ